MSLAAVRESITLVVVVASELMAIVISLVAGYFEPFGFERLALTSLFIQWIALTSAALVCQLRPRLNRLAPAVAAVAVVLLVVIDTLLFSVVAALVMGWVTGNLMPGALWTMEILVNGLIAAIATLVTGGGFLMALGAYSLGGTLGILAGALHCSCGQYVGTNQKTYVQIACHYL